PPPRDSQTQWGGRARLMARWVPSIHHRRRWRQVPSRLAARASSVVRDRALLDGTDQPTDEWDLSRLQASSCLVRREPGDSVDLRKELPPAAPGRPLHLELVGDRGRRVQVTLDRPGVDELAALLDDRVERDGRGSVGLLGGSQLADLLRELAPGDREQVFVGSI